MTLAPRVGWLLSYSYLWADDHRRGAEEGLRTGLARWSPRPDGMETA
jgi:hypothetical protein